MGVFKSIKNVFSDEYNLDDIDLDDIDMEFYNSSEDDEDIDAFIERRANKNNAASEKDERESEYIKESLNQRKQKNQVEYRKSKKKKKSTLKEQDEIPLIADDIEDDTEDNTENISVNDKAVSEIVNEFEKKYEWYNRQEKKRDEKQERKQKAMSGYDKAYEAKRKAQQEEERFDELLNSVQAKDFAKAVKKISKANEEKKESLSGILEKQEKEEAERLAKIEKQRKVSQITGGVKKSDEPPKRETINVTSEAAAAKALNTSVAQFINDYTDSDASMAPGVDKVSEYIKNQCQIMETASFDIESIMEDYNMVTRHFSDAQLIDGAPDNVSKGIKECAERIDNLAVDRRMFKSDPKKLSNRSYRRMEALEEDMPRALKYLEKQETYYETVKRDMRMLEGERLSLRMDAASLTKRQLKVKSFALIAAIGLAVVFAIFIGIMTFANDTQNILMFVAVVLLGAIIAVGMYAVLKYTERQVLVTEKKLNRAAVLLNKVKIKYINAANTLDYEYTKYNIANSYELLSKYEAYLEMKKEQQRIVTMTFHLNEAEEELQVLLKSLGIYDVNYWISKVKALYIKSEMVEARHEMTVERQKLRDKIKGKEEKINLAKQNIMNVTSTNPEYMSEALKIIEQFEKKNQKNA